MCIIVKVTLMIDNIKTKQFELKLMDSTKQGINTINTVINSNKFVFLLYNHTRLLRKMYKL